MPAATVDPVTMTAPLEATPTRSEFPAVARTRLQTLQVNVGYRCNQACTHCHVEAGPERTEMMSPATVDLVFRFIARHRIRTLDLTGGAPELHPQFRDIVTRARSLGLEVIDRCNLTVLSEPGQHDLASFLAAAGVHVIASLPCYSADNVDAQRGRGVYARSIAGIRALNAAGYADADSGLVLDFVYNPQGASLPPEPLALEADYRRELEQLGLRFNRLLTITNMPIRRFRHQLERRGELDDYMTLLRTNFAPANLAALMCRTLISIDWRGYAYDCDFNQMLDQPAGGAQTHIRDLLDARLDGAAVAVGEHCFGCTAGRGSSCGGALSA